MGETKRRNVVPLGVLVVMVLSLAVAWAYRDQQVRESQCQALYGDAVTAVDSARVDATLVSAGWASPARTCGQLGMRTAGR